MRTCEEYQELISAMLDGGLTAEETAEVEAHIASCGECRAMYEAFAAVSGMEAAEVPDTLHQNVMTKVTAAQKAFKTQNKIIRLRPILTTAACLVVVVGTLFAVRSGFMGGRKAASEALMAAPAATVADAAAPEGVMKAAAESPMEAAPTEPAAPVMFAAASEEMAPATGAAETEEGYSYANDIAGDEPLPAPEPEAKAERQSIIVEITFVSEIRIDGLTPDGIPTAVLLDNDTVISDEVRAALQPGNLIGVRYGASEETDGLVLHAEEIYLAE